MPEGRPAEASAFFVDTDTDNGHAPSWGSSRRRSGCDPQCVECTSRIRSVRLRRQVSPIFSSTGSIVASEYQAWPPGVLRRGACHPATVASSSQSVRSPRRFSPAPYSGQLRTRQWADVAQPRAGALPGQTVPSGAGSGDAGRRHMAASMARERSVDARLHLAAAFGPQAEKSGRAPPRRRSTLLTDRLGHGPRPWSRPPSPSCTRRCGRARTSNRPARRRFQVPSLPAWPLPPRHGWR